MISLLVSVALRKESVDRNYAQLEQMLDDKVALRKESVDRNIVPGHDLIGQGLSLSARRAWIEITLEMIHETLKNVALRKESVDRNLP